MPGYDPIITVYYSPNNGTAFTVRHYRVSRAGNASLAATTRLTGTTGTRVYAQPRTFSGYTYRGSHPGTVSRGVVAANGSLVLRLYYVQNPATPEPPNQPNITYTNIVNPSTTVQAPTPTTTVAPTPTPTTQPELESIENQQTPLSPMVTTSWSLISAILAALALLLGLVQFIINIRDARRKRDYEDFVGRKDKDRHSAVLFTALTVLPALLPIVLFFTLDDFTAPMAAINTNTIIVAALFILEVVLVIANRVIMRRLGDDDGRNTSELSV
jgi:hypothetical protein